MSSVAILFFSPLSKALSFSVPLYKGRTSLHKTCCTVTQHGAGVHRHPIDRQEGRLQTTAFSVIVRVEKVNCSPVVKRNEPSW